MNYRSSSGQLLLCQRDTARELNATRRTIILARRGDTNGPRADKLSQRRDSRANCGVQSPLLSTRIDADHLQPLAQHAEHAFFERQAIHHRVRVIDGGSHSKSVWLVSDHLGQ